MGKKNSVNLLKGNLYKTIILLGYPTALASIVQTLYNLADTFWLGKLGRQAISAPVISFNIIFFILSIAIGFSITGTSLVSQYTGANKPEKANKVAGNLLVYLVFLSIIFSVLGYVFSDEILKFLKTPADALTSTLDYFKIMVLGLPLAFPFFVFQSVLNGYGDTKTPLKIELISALINVIIDPILIFGFMGIPAMGVKGAAITTVISRGVSSLIGIHLLFKGNMGIKLDPEKLKPSMKLLPLMIRVGIPASVGMSGASLGFLVLIGIVNRFGTPVISAYGISTRIIHLFMMPAIAIASSVTAIVGQNLGAGQLDRAKSVIKKGIYLMFLIITPFVIITMIFGGEFTAFFIPKDPTVHQIGKVMFKIVSPAVIFYGITQVLNGAFQGSGYTVPVMITNLSRIWLFRIPMVYLFSCVILNGPKDLTASTGIWWGMFFSNFLAMIMIFIWFRSDKWQNARIKTSQKKQQNNFSQKNT